MIPSELAVKLCIYKRIPHTAFNIRSFNRQISSWIWNGFSKIVSWHLLLLLVNLKSSLLLWGVLEVQSQQISYSLYSGWEERKRWPILKNTHTPPSTNSLCRLKQVSPKVAVFKNIKGVETQLIQPITFSPMLGQTLAGTQGILAPLQREQFYGWGFWRAWR